MNLVTITTGFTSIRCRFVCTWITRTRALRTPRSPWRCMPLCTLGTHGPLRAAKSDLIGMTPHSKLGLRVSTTWTHARCWMDPTRDIANQVLNGTKAPHSKFSPNTRKISSIGWRTITLSTTIAITRLDLQSRGCLESVLPISNHTR